MKLDAGQKNLLRLCKEEADAEGWAKISATIYPHFVKMIPPELVEMEKTEDGGRARLTEQGLDVLFAMQYL
jgi:hypothetical protein